MRKAGVLLGYISFTSEPRNSVLIENAFDFRPLARHYFFEFTAELGFASPHPHRDVIDKRKKGLIDLRRHRYDLERGLMALSEVTCKRPEDFFKSVVEPREAIRTSEDVIVSRVGRSLYEKFFCNYTRKQWGLDPSELDATVTSRVPTRTTRDDRYFTDTYQAMPLYGYTRMFENMLDHDDIKILLNTDYREIERLVPYREMIYTGPIDEFFEFQYGKLPYRSLEFRHETIDKEVYQPAPVVNYPNDHPYTRVTEFKYLTGQVHKKTGIVFEYSRAEGDPYYPVPRPENTNLYKKYQELAKKTEGVHFVGRLATYKYYNQDQVVAQALAMYAKLRTTPGAQN